MFAEFIDEPDVELIGVEAAGKGIDTDEHAALKNTFELVKKVREDVKPLKEVINGAIVGSHFINMMEGRDYDLDTAGEYIRTFKQELNK